LVSGSTDLFRLMADGGEGESACAAKASDECNKVDYYPETVFVRVKHFSPFVDRAASFQLKVSRVYNTDRGKLVVQLYPLKVSRKLFAASWNS
jgi:hypothetical protein